MQMSRVLPFIACVGLTLSSAGPVSARDGLAGPYLAARHASFSNDYSAAATYYTQALIGDPSNPLLMEYAILSQVALGEVDRALPIATRLDGTGTVSQIGGLVILSDFGKREEFVRISTELDDGRSVGPLVEGLMRAWSLLGEGRMSDATTAFDAVADTQGLRGFALYL